MNQLSSWMELKIEGYDLESLLGEGAMSLVYKGRDTVDGGAVALKVAGKGLKTGGGDTGVFQSQVLERMTNGFAAIQPDPVELLRKQYEQLQVINAPEFVSVFELMECSAGTYYGMDFVPGVTLRTMLNERCVAANALHTCDLSLFQGLLALMAQLETNPAFNYHGDLKPENILVAPSGHIVLIDPGFYGTLTKLDGKPAHCVVTTPMYYPMLNADDLFATGLILWEFATGQVLLDTDVNSATDITCGVQLNEQVLGLERTGNFFFSNIRSIAPPSQFNPSISPELEDVILRGLRLQLLPDGSIESRDGYKGFDQFAEAINKAVQS